MSKMKASINGYAFTHSAYNALAYRKKLNVKGSDSAQE